MQSFRFAVMGFDRTYWDLYRGFALIISFWISPEKDATLLYRLRFPSIVLPGVRLRCIFTEGSERTDRFFRGHVVLRNEHEPVDAIGSEASCDFKSGPDQIFCYIIGHRSRGEI